MKYIYILIGLALLGFILVCGCDTQGNLINPSDLMKQVSMKASLAQMQPNGATYISNAPVTVTPTEITPTDTENVTPTPTSEYQLQYV